MEGTIRFPYLGITLTNVIKTISVGGFDIAVYGIVLAAAMMTGLLLTMKVADRTGQKGEDYFDLGICAIIVAVICARIYYVVFSWSYYSSHIAEIFNLRKGGLAIYGGILGGFAAVLLFSYIRKINYRQALDTAVIGLVWGQAVGRWGNFFNREAFGDYTDHILAMQLPVSDVRASEITDTMRAHLQTVNGVEYIQVHPTFLYESLWNLGVLSILLFLTFKVKHCGTARTCCRKKGSCRLCDGMVFLVYLLLYGVGRFWIESLRTDQLILFGTGLPVSQVLSGILVLVSIVLLIVGNLPRGRRRGAQPPQSPEKKGTKEYEQKGTADDTH